MDCTWSFKKTKTLWQIRWGPQDRSLAITSIRYGWKEFSGMAQSLTVGVGMCKTLDNGLRHGRPLTCLTTIVWSIRVHQWQESSNRPPSCHRSFSLHSHSMYRNAQDRVSYIASGWPMSSVVTHIVLGCSFCDLWFLEWPCTIHGNGTY